MGETSAVFATSSVLLNSKRRDDFFGDFETLWDHIEEHQPMENSWFAWSFIFAAIRVFVRQKPGRFEYTPELWSFHVSRDWLCWAEMRPLEVYSISISLYLRTFGNKELIP